MLSNSIGAWCTVPTEQYLHMFTEPTSCQIPGSCTKYSGLGFFVSQHTVKSKNGFSPHASMRCGGRTFSFGYIALFIYLFILEAAFDHKSQMLWLKTLFFFFFAFSVFLNNLSYMILHLSFLGPNYRSKGNFILKAKQAKTFQVTYVTLSSWRFPLPLMFTEIAESRGNKNAWFMKYFNYAHTLLKYSPSWSWEWIVPWPLIKRFPRWHYFVISGENRQFMTKPFVRILDLPCCIFFGAFFSWFLFVVLVCVLFVLKKQHLL